MGKRKSAKKVIKKERPKVLKMFNCPFCNHEQTVEVKLKRVEKRAEARCRVCPNKYKTEIGPFTAPIDVYCKWVDECAELNSEAMNPAGSGGGEDNTEHHQQRRHHNHRNEDRGEDENNNREEENRGGAHSDEDEDDDYN